MGVYRFTERLSQLNQTLQGRIIVTHDSVIVDAEPGPCTYDPQTRSNGPIMYRCAEITFSFDRYDPVGKATYRTTTTVVGRSAACTGRQTCAQRSDKTERSASVAGTLHLEIIAKPD